MSFPSPSRHLLQLFFFITKTKKEKKGKKRRSLKAETFKRLSPRSKCYCVNHSRASRILFFSYRQPTIRFSVLWPLHFKVHFAGPVWFNEPYIFITMSPRSTVNGVMSAKCSENNNQVFKMLLIMILDEFDGQNIRLYDLEFTFFLYQLKSRLKASRLFHNLLKINF